MKETGLYDKFIEQVLIFSYETMKIFMTDEESENMSVTEDDNIWTSKATKIAFGPLFTGLLIAIGVYIMEIFHLIILSYK